MRNDRDTIAALATPPGEGGIAVLRVSGPDAPAVLARCFRRARTGEIRPGRLYYGRALDAQGAEIDEVMAVWMKAPHSYTREHVCEIHCHGGRVTAARVLRALIEAGARPAEPGEFTRRAFLNGRLDLSEAEAVMGLISAGGEAAARAALHQLRGGVSELVRSARESLANALASIAASDDFPEEIDEPAAARTVLDELTRVDHLLSRAADPRGARILCEGMRVALAGRPNAGKSSLMNAMLGCDRAIVTEIAGTTRDVLTERLSLDGVTVELCDTAGLRDSNDPVEQMGVNRAKEELKRADLVLLVLDAARPEEQNLTPEADETPARVLRVLNKIDLPHDPAQFQNVDLRVSAATGEGVDALLDCIARCVRPEQLTESVMTAPRQLDCAARAREALGRARETVSAGLPLDLAAVDIQAALDILCEITGENAAESVIDRVFAQFCVGK